MTMTLTLNDIDWMSEPLGTVLHHANLSEVQAQDLEEYATVWGATFACGLAVGMAIIPSPLARMKSNRCDRCCAETGLPVGVGSPKNDRECRRILGLTNA